MNLEMFEKLVISEKIFESQGIIFELYQPLHIYYLKAIKAYECCILSKNGELDFYFTRKTFKDMKDAIGAYLLEAYNKISNISLGGMDPINFYKIYGTLTQASTDNLAALRDDKLIALFQDLICLTKVCNNDFDPELYGFKSCPA